MIKQEEQIHIALCKYIQLQYPNVIFTTESSGLRLTMRAAVVAKQCRNPKVGWCDIILLEARGGYHGLLIEVKKDESQLLTKKGVPKTDKHNMEQQSFARNADSKGYRYLYACGLDMGIEIVNDYMALPSTSTI